MNGIFNKVLIILTHTPLWVWGVFIYVMFVGIKATKERVVFLPRLFIIPIVLMVLKYKAFISGNFLFCLEAILVGCIIGFIIGLKTTIEIFKNLYAIKLPGSYSTLILLLIFFLIKYVFGYFNAAFPETAVRWHFYLLELGISSVFSGYFLGRAACYLYRFIK